MSALDRPITGGCLYGAVRFGISRAPLSAGCCHCTRCRRAGRAPADE